MEQATFFFANLMADYVSGSNNISRIKIYTISNFPFLIVIQQYAVTIDYTLPQKFSAISAKIIQKNFFNISWTQHLC